MKFLLLLSLFCIYTKLAFSKSLKGEQLACGKNTDGLDIFFTVAGPASCAVCLCNADLKEGVSYKNCETCCCEYVSNTKINDYKHLENKKDGQKLLTTRKVLYSLIFFTCLLLILLALGFLYHKKRYCSSQPPIQSTENDDVLNKIKIITNDETIYITEEHNLVLN
ncbi:uncharacterized protein LOC136084511 [Hydra vulgaris]|uniref:Uncharacterized protein LOC136084511 n=1 Tax=Hydra vulgaris TaxID=6087 RepID=A0ABM4CG26_HYDVU